MSEPVRVRLYVETGFAGAIHEDEIEIDRAEWDLMDPAERRDELDGAAQTLMANHIECGWTIDNPDDKAACDD